MTAGASCGGVSTAVPRGALTSPPIAMKWLLAVTESWQWPHADAAGVFTRSVAFGTLARAALIWARVSPATPVVIFAVVSRRPVVWMFWYRLFRWHFPQWLRSPG